MPTKARSTTRAKPTTKANTAPSRVQTAGDRLKRAREARGLSQIAAAELAGCHQSYWSNLERGTSHATLEWLHKTAHAIGVDPHDLDERLASNCDTKK